MRASSDYQKFKTRLSKQEARSFHRPALQFSANIEIRFSKVRTAKKKKDKSGRKLGKGGNVGESLHRTGDLSLRDTSNFVLWEYSVSCVLRTSFIVLDFFSGRASTDHIEFRHGERARELLSEEG